MIFRQVIGVAKTVKYGTLAEDPQSAVYVPLEQNPSDSMVLFLRTPGAPHSVLGPAQATIRALDTHVPLTNPTTMRDILLQSLWPARLAAILLGVLGALALVLASVGLYGLMAYSVAQRTQEIGMRMALGADAADVLKMVLRQSMGLAVTGLMLGLAGALAVSRLVARLLYGLSPMDPATFAGVAALLLGIALVASSVPAIRASRLDPLRALK
jgi:ABC-type antimicrobial peptide transport system permease subunit